MVTTASTAKAEARKARGIAKGFQRKTAPGDATIAAEVGGVFLGRPDHFAGEAFDPVREDLKEIQREVRGVASFARRFDEIPPDQRLLNLPKLSTRGLEALGRIANRGAAVNALARFEERMDATVQSELREVNGATQHQFSASQVRDYVRNQPEGQRTRLLREALDDLASTRAILAGPPMASGLSRNQWEEFEGSAVEKHLPDVGRGRRLVAEARKLHEGAVRNAVRLIADTAGLKESRQGWVPVWEVGDE